jgi:hypothetical protein
MCIRIQTERPRLMGRHIKNGNLLGDFFLELHNLTAKPQFFGNLTRRDTSAIVNTRGGAAW